MDSSFELESTVAEKVNEQYREILRNKPSTDIPIFLMLRYTRHKCLDNDQLDLIQNDVIMAQLFSFFLAVGPSRIVPSDTESIKTEDFANKFNFSSLNPAGPTRICYI